MDCLSIDNDYILQDIFLLDSPIEDALLLTINDELSNGPTTTTTGTTALKRKYRPLSDEARARRNARRRTCVKRIRLLKEDLRRNIPVMLANAANSCDKAMIQSFFDQYGHPDIRFTDYSPCLKVLDTAFSCITVLQGVEKMARYASSFREYVPDMSIRVLNSEVRVRADGSCLIVNRTHFSSTLLFYPPISEDQQQIKRLLDQGNVVVKESNASLAAQGPQADEMVDLIRRCEDLPAFWQGNQCTEPIDAGGEGFVIIHMDENGYIDTIDIVSDIDAPEKYYLPLQKYF
eukprot:scaffold654_cov207-Ochromonas_danica.AAC.32